MPKQITITQALAEVRTLKERIAKQAEFVQANAAYASNMVDPHARSGGSHEVIRRARQSISDMQERIILLRTSISLANAQSTITIGGITRTINAWLVWKREVGPDVRRYQADLRRAVDTRRNAVANEVHRINQQRGQGETLKVDLVVAFNEAELNDEIGHFEQVWGELDGELSMVNSRIVLELPE